LTLIEVSMEMIGVNMKSKTNNKKLYSIRIIDEVDIEITRAATEDQWDDNDTYTNHSIKGFVLDDSYGDLYLSSKPEANKDYFLLYALYSTGDSFHYEDNVIAFIDLYKTQEDALVVKDILSKSKEYSAKVKDNEGNILTYNCPWLGYFERLRSLEIESIQLR
jgi:hypothetical protein